MSFLKELNKNFTASSSLILSWQCRKQMGVDVNELKIIFTLQLKWRESKQLTLCFLIKSFQLEVLPIIVIIIIFFLCTSNRMPMAWISTTSTWKLLFLLFNIDFYIHGFTSSRNIIPLSSNSATHDLCIKLAIVLNLHIIWLSFEVKYWRKFASSSSSWACIQQ